MTNEHLYQNFLPQLKQHLFPRILVAVEGKRLSVESNYDHGHASPGDVQFNPDTILFKHDRMYKHHLIRLHYTTYNVRRSQDVVNPSTAHHNVMVLVDEANDGRPSAQNHLFRYARVLGIYHVNVVYTGPGMVNYEPIRMEFLWVRWYQIDGAMLGSWTSRRLDRVSLCSVLDQNAFGYIDPSQVLRGCHIVPAFREGRSHVDGVGLSKCARDSQDWQAYVVMR
jgi:hypothetical protein